LASQSPAQHINVLQRPIFRAIPKTAPAHMFEVKQTFGRYNMQTIIGSSKDVPNKIIHKTGNIKFGKAWFFREGSLMVAGNHLT
jgi:hypothetical protein